MIRKKQKANFSNVRSGETGNYYLIYEIYLMEKK